MIKDSKVFSYVSKDDYLNRGGSFMKTYYKDDLTGQITGWTIDPLTGIVTSRADASYTNHVRSDFKFLKAGDQIEFTGEFVDSGHPIVFMLEYSPNEDMSGLTWEEGITTLDNLSDTPETRKFVLNIKKDGYYRLYVGCYQNSPSEFKMRNLVVRVNSIQTINPVIETGSWTPSISGATGTMLGTYTIIGKRVTIKAHMSLTNKGTNTGALTINGLPYTPKTGQANYGSAQVTNATLDSGYNRLYSNLALGNKTAYIRKTGNGLGNTFLTFAEITNTSELFIEITYDI